MKKLFHIILSIAMIALLLVFSSGIHLYTHHCLIADETEIVFSVKEITCDHHETTESSCCGHHHDGCCSAPEEEHHCDHSHAAIAEAHTNSDELSFNPITCEVAEYHLILDKNNISPSINFNVEKALSLLLNDCISEIFPNNIAAFNDILLAKLLYPDEQQPVLHTGTEIVYLFGCPKIPFNYYC